MLTINQLRFCYISECVGGGGGVSPQTAVGLQSCFLICMYNLLELLSVIMFGFYSAVRCSCPALCAKPALWISSAGQVGVSSVCLHARQWQPYVDIPVVSLFLHGYFWLFVVFAYVRPLLSFSYKEASQMLQTECIYLR